MDKIKNKLLKCVFIFVIATYFLILIKYILLDPYDELWNFQSVLKMYNGYEIYSDINVIITPLFFYLGLLVLKIFGPTLISFRIYNVILVLVCFRLIYCIYKELKVTKHINYLFTTIIFFVIVYVLNSGANYNLLAIDFMMLGMFLYLKKYKKENNENNESNNKEVQKRNDKIFDYVQGIIVFLVFASKQNLGIYYLCAIIVHEFFVKDSVREWIIKQIRKVILFMVLLLILSGCLMLNGNFYSFLNYTFGGLFEFGNKNLVFAIPAHLLIFCIFIIISIIFIYRFGKKHCSKEYFKNLNLLICVAFFSTFLCFPISNEAHVLYVLIFYFLVWFYFIDYVMVENCFSDIKYEKYFIVMCSALIVFWNGCFGVTYNEVKDGCVMINDEQSKYKYLYISEIDLERITKLKEYVSKKKKENKQVIILSYEAVLPMTELDINNGDFDLAFVGNLGYDGENKLIEKIKNLDNAEILIFTDENECFWQESKIAREYIMNNLTKIGEIENYSVYECD